MDNVTNNILLTKIIDAFMVDQDRHRERGLIKKGLSKNKLQELVIKLYPQANVAAVRQGYSKGKKLMEDPNANVGFTTTTENLEYLVQAILIHLGSDRDFPNVRQEIARAGRNYEYLLKYKPRSVNESIKSFKEQPFSEIADPNITVGEALRVIGDHMDEIAKKFDQTTKELSESNNTILMLNKEKAKDRAKIELLKDILSKIKDDLATISDKDQIKKAKDLIAKIENQQKNILL